MLVMTAAASFAMATAMAVVRPEAREGVGLWALALVLHGSCYALYALRGQIPDAASVVLANTLLTGVFALMLAAVEQFHGRPLPWWRMALPVALGLLLFGWFAGDYRARQIIVGTLGPAQLALVLWALWRPLAPAQPRGAWLLSASVLAEVLLMLGRGALALSRHMDNAGLLQISPTQAAVFVLAFVTIILASLGLLLMTKDRADAANRHLASHDALTGLANRRTLVQALARDMAHAVRIRGPYALVLLDIDHFKTVNDTRGHRAGDQVLRHVAGVLAARLRRQDLPGRYGGEEFLVLLPGTDLAGALQVAETLRQAVQDTPCPQPDGPIAVTISLGVCAARPHAPGCGEALIDAADRALYAAKQAGRNRVQHGPAPECPADAG
ncbi:GGDEF domain-containing protein [Melaminivora suipulveris]|uniref:diguanylate cyclase n=2 Tax=Melaminivora suipulveris TaxID=2109913 RepID=A0A2R3QCC6_9BURK|nr:GGDEF domain-containing protein [Melaminivora suipulveris]